MALLHASDTQVNQQMRKLQNHVAMINLQHTLDRRWKRKDGTYSITLRITFKGKSRDLKTGFTCKESDWDERYKVIKVTSDSLKILNNRLREQRLKHQERLLEFERNLLDTSTDAQVIKEFLSGKVAHLSTVEDFWEQEVKRMISNGRHGNARNYKCALNGVRNVMVLSIPFSKMDYAKLIEIDTKLKAKGVTQNSVSVYMRSLRAIYNSAINMGIVEQSSYPFRKYKIKTTKTSPRVATIGELHRYFTVCPPITSIEYNHWNFGKLIFMLRGINFTDLALLTKDNIKHDRLVYRRSKTHKLYSVKLHPAVVCIFEHYHEPDRLALIPILTNDELLNKAIHPSRIGQLRKTTNKHLKKLGIKASIAEPLSSYVFRYSFANACKKLGYSKDLIAEALGHEYGNSITGIYLEQFDLELVDEMNDVVITKVTGE